MANRFWVGGTANWDGTAGSKWALTSGGAGGQAVPTTSDDVFFDAASGAVTVTTGATINALSLNFTGFTGTFAGSNSANVAGSITLVSGMTFSYTGTPTISGTGSITSAGKTFGALTVNGAGITVTPVGALSITNALTLTAGTFSNSNNVAIAASSFSSSNSNTRTVALGNATWTLSGNAGTTPWNTSTTTGLTVTPGTSLVRFTGTQVSSSTMSLTLGGITLNNVEFPSPDTIYSLTGSNTFANMTIVAGGVLRLAPSATQTLTTLTAVGTAADPILVTSAGPDTNTTISVASGTVAMQYVGLQRVTFSGGATFTDNPGFDLGNNNGVTITSPGGGGSTNQITRQGLSL